MRSLLRTWSLRRRLVATVTVVAVVALVSVDIATYRSLQRSLLDRVDRQLSQVAQESPPGQGPADRPAPLEGRPAPPRESPIGTWMAVFTPTASGTYGAPINETVQGVSSFRRSTDIPQVHVTRAFVAGRLGSPATYSSADGSTKFRVQVRGLREGDYMVVALPLTDYTATLDRLRNIELVVSLIAVFGIFLLALVTVRAGLRPLDAIARAAAGITHDAARGRIGERVPIDASASTEVGRLATSINEMLDSLDESFDAQRATQQQLRRFISDASHELRTPLTSIQGFAELARTRAADMTDVERDTALLRVEQEATHLTGLVEELLILSRLDEGLPLHVERVDVAKIAAVSVDAARVIEPARTIDFESAGPVHIDVDPIRVRQIVDNLLANARTHAGGDASVGVQVVALENPAGARITVTDTGVGMAAGDREHATDRFWRADTARTRATGGSGLGLSMVRSIAEAHGGTVTVEPGHDGRGLCVTVDLRSSYSCPTE